MQIKPQPASLAGFFISQTRPANDYNNMRIISDELYAKLVQQLAADEKVKIFQQLILAKKIEATDDKKNESEAKENGIR